MKIGDFKIGERAFIVAEIGSNHNGDFRKAIELVSLAKEAKADAVKFQTYEASKYIDSSVEPMAHVRGIYKTQQERFKSLEFEKAQWEAIIRHCRDIKIIFFSTPSDKDSVDFLEPYVPVYKIQSGDVTNMPLIRHVASKGKPVIMSTGMAAEDEIEEAVKEVPRDNLILLHCVSVYPTPPDKVSLLSIPHLRERFNLPVGYSDHTMDSLASLAAVALGAVVIERHFTDSKNQAAGDHRFSATPEEFKRMAEDIREIEKMRAPFGARLTESELKMRYAMRRGLAFTRDIAAGTKITEDMLVPLRPEKGISPLRYDRVIGKKVAKDMPKGTFPEEKDIAG